ncbi:hypothetical protein Tco_0641425 [Tanacetum coccineum]
MYRDGGSGGSGVIRRSALVKALSLRWLDSESQDGDCDGVYGQKSSQPSPLVEGVWKGEAGRWEEQSSSTGTINSIGGSGISSSSAPQKALPGSDLNESVESSGAKPDNAEYKIACRDYTTQPSGCRYQTRTVTDWKGKPSLRSTDLQKNPIFHISVDISRTQTSLGHSLHQQIPFYLHSARSLLHDNIVPKPDLALELGKSISLTEAEEEAVAREEAEEEAVAREVHATHARIVSGPDPEPMQEDQTGSNSGKLHVSLAGPNPEHMDDELTEAEEEAVAREVHATHARIVSGPDPEPMQEDQTGSNSGKLHIHVSLAGPNPEHMDDEFLATAYPKVHENLKLITDERVIEENPESHSGSMSSMKNLDDTYNFGDQFLYDKPTEDDQEKSKVIEESDSTIPDPSHQTVTSTPPVIAPFTDVSSTKPSSLVTPPPINTEATTITTSLPEITPFIALQLRVARLEQEMSEVKKTDHSTCRNPFTTSLHKTQIETKKRERERIV